MLLRRANELYLNEAVRKEKLSLIGEMAGSLMHDLRSPVQVVLSSIELIRMKHEDPETRDCCAKMEVQCDRMIAMAGELLEFSRGETEAATPVRTTTPSRCSSSSFPTCRRLSSQADVEIDIDGPGGDPHRRDARLQRCDAKSGRQRNRGDPVAAKRRTDRPAHVEQGGFDALPYGALTTDPACPSEVNARLFEPFVTYGKQKGIGLGLSIVRKIVLAHGGTIDFESTAEKGTTFTIKLPQHSHTQQLPMLVPRAKS